MGNTGRNICPSVQPHDWRPCEASEAGVWSAVHQVAAWLDRWGDRRADPRKCLHAVFPWFCRLFQQGTVGPIDDGTFPKAILGRGSQSVNELIAERGKEMVMQAVASIPNDDLISKKTPQNGGAALGMVGSSPQLSGSADAMSSG